MAESDHFAAVEAQMAQVNAQFEEVLEVLQIPPDSRPVFAVSTLEAFGQVLSKAIEDLDSYRQRWATIDEREIRLAEGKKNLEEKEKLLAEETTKRLERDQRSEEKAAELKKWEERLAERESDVNKREKLLIERTRAVDRRDMNIDRLAEDARTGLQRVAEARTALDARKETIIAAKARQAADEQALERWQEFLQQKHDNVIALNETMNELRIAARSEHNNAVEQLNEDMRTVQEALESAERTKTTVLNMYQKARSMMEDMQKTEISVVRNYEKMLNAVQDEKQNISRLQVHATLFSKTISSDDREIASLLDKVGRLSSGLEKVGNEVSHQEARFDDALKKISQLTDASGNLDNLTKKLEAFTIAASKLDSHRVSHDIGSSPEKGPPAKRQRYSRRAVSVGPTEMLSSNLGRQEPLPADIPDPFIASGDWPRPDQGLGSSDSLAPFTQAVQTSSTSNVQSSGPGTLNPSSQAVGSTSASSTDPKDLADASEFIKGVWSQIKFPRDWQMQDSKTLLEKFVKHEKKDFHWRPDACMNRGARWMNEGDKRICLLREFTKKKAAFPDGIEKRCEECKKKGGPCVNVLWGDESEEAEGAKKWLLVKRK